LDLTLRISLMYKKFAKLVVLQLLTYRMPRSTACEELTLIKWLLFSKATELTHLKADQFLIKSQMCTQKIFTRLYVYSMI